MDGRFVYAVKTTGIFCRPSCPSRRPKPGNVVIYDSAQAALAAGYRPCLRCHPLDARHVDGQASLMQAMAAYIDAHAGDALTLAGLSVQAGLSPAHFQRVFTAAMGVSPKAYHAAARLRALKAGLRGGSSVLQAIFDAGYGSTSRVYEQAGSGLGMTPSAYRAGGAGETIVHATRETSLGPLMMAATVRGVCFVQFGADEAALQREFPQARLEAAGAGAAAPLEAWMSALAAHLDAGGPSPDLPLDLRGTAFQIRVWRFLMGVKPGDAVSYSELAAGIGAPGAVRAAASACAANRVAVLVPCHRALRADGGLGGYRWGLDRKRALLAAERSSAAQPARS